MKNKQGTQNNTNFLDFWKKYPKWQYNWNLSNKNCPHVTATAGGLIRWTIFSHLYKILSSFLDHFQRFPDLCITFTSNSLPVILVTSPGNLLSLYEIKTLSLMFIMILSCITWSGSSTSSPISPSASLKLKSGSASLPSVTFVCPQNVFKFEVFISRKHCYLQSPRVSKLDAV